MSRSRGNSVGEEDLQELKGRDETHASSSAATSVGHQQQHKPAGIAQVVLVAIVVCVMLLLVFIIFFKSRADDQRITFAPSSRTSSPATTATLAPPSPSPGSTTTDGTKDWKGCETPFGDVIGWADGVPAYSNCNDSYTSMEWSYLASVPLLHNTTGWRPGAVRTNLYVGMKWQCVEYARRYLAWTMNYIFGDVDGAADIWGLPTAVEVTPDGVESKQAAQPLFLSIPSRVPFNVTQLWEAVLANGTTSTSESGNLALPQTVDQRLQLAVPRKGDLLIYDRQRGNEMPYGHVAVVVGVDLATGTFNVGEENWSSYPWGGFSGNYSRSLTFSIQALGLTESPGEGKRWNGTALFNATDSSGIYIVKGLKRIVV